MTKNINDNIRTAVVADVPEIVAIAKQLQEIDVMEKKLKTTKDNLKSQIFNYLSINKLDRINSGLMTAYISSKIPTVIDEASLINGLPSHIIKRICGEFSAPKIKDTIDSLTKEAALSTNDKDRHNILDMIQCLKEAVTYQYDQEDKFITVKFDKTKGDK